MSPRDRERADADSALGRVVAVHLGEVTVEDAAGRPVPCRVRRVLKAEAARTQLHAVAVGDFVRFRREADGTGLVLDVAPRRTFLARAEPRRPWIQHVIAVNIEQLVIVVSLRAPAPRLGLIDRYLAAANIGSLRPLLVINKTDLGDAAEQAALAAAYEGFDLPIVLASTATGEGLAAVGAALAGRESVLVGHSGVGKSSLLNALRPDLELPTGEVSEATSKGRHTTSWIRMVEVAPGARVIDSAGIREFRPWGLKPEDLPIHFPEMIEFLERCRFRDCSHTHEERCGVRAAVESGLIRRSRYHSYLRLREDLAAGARFGEGGGS